MAIQEVTSPPLLDETGQDIVTELQNIVSALSPNAQGVSYSHATSGLSAENVQEGIDEVKGITDTINNSLTQLIKSKKVHGTTEATGNLVLSTTDVPLTYKIMSIIPQRQNSSYYTGFFTCTLGMTAAQDRYILSCLNPTTTPPTPIATQNVEVEIIYTEMS